MAISKVIIKTILQSFTKFSTSVITPTPLFRNPQIRSLTEIPASRRNLIPLSIIFQRYGFSPSQLPDFLNKNDFLLQLTPSEIEKSFKILISLKPSSDFIVSTVSNCPRVLEIGFLEKWELSNLEWEISEITSMAVSNMLEVSKKFGLSPDDVFNRVKSLRSLGFSEGSISRVLEVVPMVIMSEPNEIRRKFEFLMEIGFQRNEIDRVFNLFPGILTFDVRNRLKPLLDEFWDLGFSLNEIRREILRNPTVFGLENGELSECVEMLRTLKCRTKIKEDIFRNGEFRAGYNMKLRIDCLRKYGLIYRDAFTVLWKEPRIMLYEIVEVEKKIDFLVQIKFDIQCLVEVPEYLGVNFDKQIVPRFKVIEYLRLNGRLDDEVSLRDLIKVSRMRFYNMYVKPYPECEKIYGRFAGGVKVQNRHPVGMWKLFRPQQYQSSREDVKNIKSFVESVT